MVVPRVISELLKTDTRQQHQSEPQQRQTHRLTGQLHWYEHGSWLPRTAEVTAGCLWVRGGVQELRLPLRHLSLRPASQPRAFVLTAQHDRVVAMFKAGSQMQYDRWVKALAVELLRQTPLEDVRFHDILAITATVGREESSCRGRTRARMCHKPEDSSEVADLLARCQQGDNYVPVKEKRRLFESLCRHNKRLAHSSENLCSESSLPSVHAAPRAQSLHDLSRGSVAVKDMCRYFEERGKQSVLPARSSPEAAGGVPSRGKLERWQRRLAVLRNQVVDSEDKIWRLQDKMAALDQQRPGCRGRSRDLKNHAVLEKRLGEEEARLVHLQDAASRALRKVEKSTAKLG